MLDHTSVTSLRVNGSTVLNGFSIFDHVQDTANTRQVNGSRVEYITRLDNED